MCLGRNPAMNCSGTLASERIREAHHRCPSLYAASRGELRKVRKMPFT